MTRDRRIGAVADGPGTSQTDRDDPRLDPAHAPVDGRDAAELLRYLRALAAQVRYYGADPDSPAGNWAPWFGASDDDLLARSRRSDGDVAPHLALVFAFLAQYRGVQALLDRFTAGHLQFQLQRVLGFEPRPARPDRAHLVLELKKDAAGPLRIDAAQAFTAGARRYGAVRPAWVSAARVQRLAALRRDGDRLVAAPVAASADGQGAPLDPAAPRWPAFALHSHTPAAVGVALASPLLRLAGGERRIEATLAVDGVQPRHAVDAVAASFEAWLSGPKGWIGPLPVAVQAAPRGGEIAFTVELSAQAPAVVDHAAAVHAQPFPDGAPVLQLKLRAAAPLAFGAFEGIAWTGARLAVAVRGLRALQLENDFGPLDAAHAFMPFGPQPVAGSRLMVGCAEALAKPLSAFAVRLRWQGAPADLHGWYRNYARQSAMRNVAATLAFETAAGTLQSVTVDLMARDAAGESLLSTAGGWSPPRIRTAVVASRVGGRPRDLAVAAGLVVRAFAAPPPPEPRAGFVTIALVDDFLHADYRRDAAKALLKQPPDPLNEPYTPTVQQISVDYASSAASAQADGPAIDRFHVDAFGVAPLGPGAAAPLLPPHDDAGELMIGLSGVAAGDSVGLLLQVAEGSADPDAAPQALRWSVLSGNAWLPLGEAVALDTTRGLRASGVVEVALPLATTLTGTRAGAPGLAWLRASVAGDPRAACDLVGVHANAVEVRFDADAGDADGAVSLPPGSIAKALPPLPAVKTVAQPYPSFDGAAAEGEAALARRAAERLRHRDRAAGVWDWSRIVLEAFPAVHRVKCIPHARPGSWSAPGHVLLVLTPDLRGRGAGVADLLQPKVDLDTQQRVQAHAAARAAQGVTVWVRNPRYSEVRLALKLRPLPGVGFNALRATVQAALRRALSPWAHDGARAVEFGGRVDRSVLVDLVEEIEGVDFVTDVRMTVDGGPGAASAEPDAPDAVLTSAPQHLIEPVDG